jgi:hypothetical protein
MNFEKSDLFEIAYGNDPMNRTLAVAIRKFRCVNKMAYEKLPHALNSGFGNDFTLGKELCVKARVFLGGTEAEWD